MADLKKSKYNKLKRVKVQEADSQPLLDRFRAALRVGIRIVESRAEEDDCREEAQKVDAKRNSEVWR